MFQVLIELIHMAFGLQDEACSSQRSNVNILHSLVAAFLVFASRYLFIVSMVCVSIVCVMCSSSWAMLSLIYKKLNRF